MADIIHRREQQPAIWDPFRLMNELMGWAPMTRFAGRDAMAFSPDFELKETDTAYIIQADVPGVRDEDLQITLAGNQLTVSGKRESRREEEDPETRYYTYERRFGTFTRTFTLPSECATDNIEADLDNGVLTITVPKSPESQPRKISLKERVKEALTGNK